MLHYLRDGMLGTLGVTPQRTLGGVASCRGIGLHGGQPVAMRVHPAPADTGIVFVRNDLDVEIRANWECVLESPLCTMLSNGDGAQIGTTEHLMAAFAGCRVDNAVVEIDGPEVPIMDGSAAPFVAMLERVGSVEQAAPRLAIKVLKPISVSDNGASAALLPDHGFSMSFEIDFDSPLIRRQDLAVSFEADTLKTELAAARSFGRFEDWPRLKAAGLARGASLDNAVVISGNRVLNQGGLRFADEFVRHKMLDAVGDLYLAGGPIIGHFQGVRSGHALTRRLLATLFADPRAWCHTTAIEAEPPGAIGRRLPREVACA